MGMETRVLSGFGHKPDELGGYDDDNFAKLVAFAVDIIPQYDPTKIISGMSLGWEQALAMAAIELDIPLVAALPFEGQETVWPDRSQRFYWHLLRWANKITVSPGKFETKKFRIRDEYIIDNCEDLVVLDRNWDVPDLQEVTVTREGDDITFTRVKTASLYIRPLLQYAEVKERKILQVWPLWETWSKEVSFDNFRESMLEMSAYEG